MKKFIATLVFTLTTVICMAQLTNGVYKLTRYQKGNLPEEAFPFEVYKIIRPAGVLKMEFLKIKPLHFLFTPDKLDPKDVMGYTESSFDHCWICDMPNHKTIDYGTIVGEHYDKDFKSPINMQSFFQTLSGVTTPTSKNPLIGIWKIADDNNVEGYKIYTKDVRYLILVQRNTDGDIQSISGSVYPVKFLKDNKTIEAGSPCQIYWSTQASHTLTYEYKGKSITERWEQAELPSDLTQWFTEKEDTEDIPTQSC